MIGDLLSTLGKAQKLDINSIKRAVQDGTLPAYVGIPLIDQKLKQRKEAEGLLAGQQKQMPIAQQVMAQADQLQMPQQAMPQMPRQMPQQAPSQGIEAMPSNLPQQYARGGIINYGAGDLIDDEEDDDREMSQLFPSNDALKEQAYSMLGNPMGEAYMPAMIASQAPSIRERASQGIKNLKGTADKVFDFIMQKEGGYVHHKADRGGPTNMGVTQKTLSTYLGRPASVEDVKNVNRDTARDIFHTMYWQPMGADKLDPKVDALAVDTAWGSGQGRAKELLRKHGDSPESFLQAKEDLYRQIAKKDPSQKAFLKGWLNRNEDLGNFIGREFAKGGIINLAGGDIAGLRPDFVGESGSLDAPVDEPQRKPHTPRRDIFSLEGIKTPTEAIAQSKIPSIRNLSSRPSVSYPGISPFEQPSPPLQPAPSWNRPTLQELLNPKPMMVAPPSRGIAPPTAPIETPSGISGLTSALKDIRKSARIGGDANVFPSMPGTGGIADINYLNLLNEEIAKHPNDANLLEEREKLTKRFPNLSEEAAKLTPTKKEVKKLVEPVPAKDMSDQNTRRRINLGDKQPSLDTSEFARTQEMEDAEAGQVQPTQTSEEEKQVTEPKDDYVQQFRNRLFQQMEEAKSEKDTNKYLGLLAAGLGMMGGTSPFAAANIGKGGIEGLGAYSGLQAASNKRLQDLQAQELGLYRYEQAAKGAEETRRLNERLRLMSLQQAKGLKEAELAETQRRNKESEQLRNEAAFDRIQASTRQSVLNTLKLNPTDLLGDADLAAKVDQEVERQLAKNPRYKQLYPLIMGTEYQGSAINIDPDLQERMKKYLKK